MPRHRFEDDNGDDPHPHDPESRTSAALVLLLLLLLLAVGGGIGVWYIRTTQMRAMEARAAAEREAAIQLAAQAAVMGHAEEK